VGARRAAARALAPEVDAFVAVPGRSFTVFRPEIIRYG
jgi:hypothetical protein